MATRAIINIVDNGETVATLYKHFDGYPEGLGKQLTDIIGTKNSDGEYVGDLTYNNGGCLAASIVAALKTGWGDVYIMAPGTKDNGEEYTYTVTSVGRDTTLECRGVYDSIQNFAINFKTQ